MFRTVHSFKHRSFDTDDDDDNFVRNAARGIHDDDSDTVSFFTANIPHDNDNRHDRDLSRCLCSFQHHTTSFYGCNGNTINNRDRDSYEGSSPLSTINESFFQKMRKPSCNCPNNKHVNTNIGACKSLKKSYSEGQGGKLYMSDSFLNNSYPPVKESLKHTWQVDESYKIIRRK